MRDPRITRALLLAAWCLLMLLACGRKTAVKAPELVAPETIDNLSAVNLADGIRLSWRRPARYVDGSRMNDLGAFRVERGTAGDSFAPVATIAVTDQDRFQQERRFRWTDTDTVVGQMYQYRVVSVTIDEYASAASNIATIERAIPTPEPTAAPTAAPTLRP